MEQAKLKTSDTAAKHILTYAGVWFAVLAWGLSFVAARYLLHPETAGQATLSPTVLAAARFSLASLFFVGSLARALFQRQIACRDLLRMALLGQITFSKIDASRLAVYIYFEPVVAVLFGVTLLAEPLSWQVIAGAVLIAESVVMVNLIKRRGDGSI